MSIYKLGLPKKNFLNFGYSKLTSYTKKRYILFMENLVPLSICTLVSADAWDQLMARLSLP